MTKTQIGNNMKELTNEQLERILITSDGKGREVKREALAELMARIEEDAFEKGKERQRLLAPVGEEWKGKLI